MNEHSMEYVRNALFIYDGDNASRLDELTQFSPDIDIRAEAMDQFLATAYTLDPAIEHLVVCATLDHLKAVIEVALQLDISLGILPEKDQKKLHCLIGLPADEENQVDLALQKNQQAMDLIRCNDQIVLFSAGMGRMPVGKLNESATRLRFLWQFMSGLKRIRLIGFTFTLPNKKPIDTAASGCVIVTHAADNFTTRLIASDGNALDGMVSLLVAAPSSIMRYLGFLYRVLKGHITIQKLPDTLGYIKTRELTIETSQTLQLDIDGQAAGKTPVTCKVQPLALKINRMPNVVNTAKIDTSERIELRNLPMGNEKIKAMRKNVPFFPYATEERFKELFVVLRQDAQRDASYLTLMFLSAVLATVGLFLNSSSVIIGAMLLAPLMAPIVSLSMGMLRSEFDLYVQSAITIASGILIALAASASITYLLPTALVTEEMSARLNPSLLDLAVAIFAGIAAAYTKSDKKMLSGLAGVAIAVALVPPLSVAGVGLGRLDFNFFSQAFLLFATNLVGIIISAALTFRVLGYSAAIKARKSFIYVMLTLALISVPLYLSTEKIVDNVRAESAWKKERFLVNGKYLVIKQIKRYKQGDTDVIEMVIVVRDNLSRHDLDVLKDKIRSSTDQKLLVRANITYRL
jgi:uncharacterized hydrophobic protein (TIGR00271 family)